MIPLRWKYRCPKPGRGYPSQGGVAGVKDRKRNKSGKSDPPHPLGQRVLVITADGRRSWQWR